jgi:hypothetical protein
MPKTCHQHYAVYSFLRQPAVEEADSGTIVALAVNDISERFDIN